MPSSRPSSASAPQRNASCGASGIGDRGGSRPRESSRGTAGVGSPTLSPARRRTAPPARPAAASAAAAQEAHAAPQQPGKVAWRPAELYEALLAAQVAAHKGGERSADGCQPGAAGGTIDILASEQPTLFKKLSSLGMPHEDGRITLGPEVCAGKALHAVRNRSRQRRPTSSRRQVPSAETSDAQKGVLGSARGSARQTRSAPSLHSAPAPQPPAVAQRLSHEHATKLSERLAKPKWPAPGPLPAHIEAELQGLPPPRASVAEQRRHCEALAQPRARFDEAHIAEAQREVGFEVGGEYPLPPRRPPRPRSASQQRESCKRLARPRCPVGSGAACATEESSLDALWASQAVEWLEEFERAEAARMAPLRRPASAGNLFCNKGGLVAWQLVRGSVPEGAAPTNFASCTAGAAEKIMAHKPRGRPPC